MTRHATWLGLCLALLPAACAGDGAGLQGSLDGVMDTVNTALSGGELAGDHIEAIRSVHEETGWRFRPDADGALETTREAVRGLADSDYGTWSETALATQILSSMAEEHPAGLVRAEALDSLARMAGWTLEREVDTGDWATEPEMIGALQVLRDATGLDAAEHPEMVFQVADAIRTVGAFDFEAGVNLDKLRGRGALGRRLASQLRNARGVLFALTSKTMDGFRGEPEVRDAAERSCLRLSATVIRLTITSASLNDAQAATRATAVRHLRAAHSPVAGNVLQRILEDDADAAVRRQAATSLGSYDLDQAFPILLQALTDDMPEVRGAAARSLEGLSGLRLGEDRAGWLEWWRGRGRGSPGEGGEQSVPSTR